LTTACQHQARIKLNADLIADKDIKAKAMEQFLIWKKKKEEKDCQKAIETSNIFYLSTILH
jgi:hypothetical protein